MRASEGPACGRITHGPHPLSPSPQMWRGGTTGQHFFPSFSSGATRRCHPERARACARAKDLLVVASRMVLTPCPPPHRCGEGERRANISSLLSLPERRGVVILSERAHARERRTCLWSHHAWSSPPVPLPTDVERGNDGPTFLPFFLFRSDAALSS